jgi:hypothetical protein
MDEEDELEQAIIAEQLRKASSKKAQAARKDKKMLIEPTASQ